MSAATYSKLKREIKKELLKEWIVPILEETKDPEGEYRSEFVKEIFFALREKPAYKYNPKSFLKLIA